jgi:hypothetical protein
MKTHKSCRIELAASKDKARVAIAEPYLDIKDGKAVLVATDGKILAIVPVSTDTADTAGYVGANVLKEARRCSRRTDDVFLEVNSAARLPNGATLPRAGASENQNYPNWRAVVPEKYETPAIEVGIDAWRLWQLAQAMGTQCVRISVQSNDKPMLVYPLSGGRYSDAAAPVNMEASGVIMPVTLGKDTP